MRGPLRMACEQAAYKYDVIGEEKSKSQADYAGSKLEPRIRLSREPVHIRERRRYGSRYKNHAQDCSTTKDEQVCHSPSGIAYRR